jgi:tetratricopeptide (TPR) repeat protein
MVQQIDVARHPSRQTSRVRNVIVAVQVLVPLALVLVIYARTMRNQGQLIARVNRDDWRGARDAATEIIERDSRWIPRATRAHATQLVGVAHLVLGELPEARVALERALATDLPAPLRASAERQLASVERSAGDFDGARARLESSAACASDGDRWAVAAQLAQVLIDAGDPAHAEETILRAIAELQRRHDATHTPVMQAAVAADLVQAQCVLMRARIDQGDLEGAVAAHAQRVSSDGRPYVQGEVAETDARLALLRGDRAAAKDLVEVATSCYAQVGARLDGARVGIVRARVDRDLATLDAAEAELRALGALGHLREVEAARREISGLG